MAFSVKDSSYELSQIDPGIHKALTELVCLPESFLANPWNQLAVQAKAEQGIDSMTVESFPAEERSEQRAPVFNNGVHATMAEPDEKTIRRMVLEVIVRQALSGASWRDICAVPMSNHKITAEQVEAEVQGVRLRHEISQKRYLGRALFA
jgi:hypothetical protein